MWIPVIICDSPISFTDCAGKSPLVSETFPPWQTTPEDSCPSSFVHRLPLPAPLSTCPALNHLEDFLKDQHDSFTGGFSPTALPFQCYMKYPSLSLCEFQPLYKSHRNNFPPSLEAWSQSCRPRAPHQARLTNGLVWTQHLAPGQDAFSTLREQVQLWVSRSPMGWVTTLNKADLEFSSWSTVSKISFIVKHI